MLGTIGASVRRAHAVSEPRLLGRHAECEGLDRLLASARAGASGTIVVRGEAGAGKTAMLDYVLAHSAGCVVARAAGVESEMELPFAGLHQICAPFLDRLAQLPAPQRDALEIAFGLRDGEPPNPFLVGLAVLSLLSDLAEAQPVVCLLDDAQWLDHASSQVLGFVARRLAAEGVVIIFTVREPGDDGHLAGLPQLTLVPLRDPDARQLLAAAIPGRLDEPVRDRIVAEAGGNPLALLELPRAWTPATFAGGFALPDGVSVSSRIEESFRCRLTPLPDRTRRLLLIAAADGVGDPVLIWAAAKRLGIPVEAAEPATAAGLLDVGTQLRFRHPLVRSVVYRDASIGERQLVHAALAGATDPTRDPDRRAWHLAAAAAGPDEDVALELERSAGRAQARGGPAAAAAFLSCAANLTRDTGLRGGRALAAALASLQAGAFDEALGLVISTDAGSLDEFQRAQIDLVRAHVALASGLGGDAPSLLLDAAQRLEAFDVELAKVTYLDAWAAVGTVGSLAGRAVLQEICLSAQALLRLHGGPLPLDLLLDGLTRLVTDGHAVAAATLQRAAEACSDIPVADVLRWGHFAACAYAVVWDFEGMHAVCARHVQIAREAGALTNLSLHLNHLSMARQWMGDFAGAEVLIAEEEGVAAATGGPIGPSTLPRLRALQGRGSEARGASNGPAEDIAPNGQGMAAGYAQWAAAVLYNGLGRYPEAVTAARLATLDTIYPFPSMCALPELVEAAARAGDSALAREAFERLAKSTQPIGTDVALGIEARCRALLIDGPAAEDSHREAIDRLGRTRLRPDYARARLVYGEWLRREGRRLDAREQLRIALDLFDSMGMQAFGERARRELLATGETARKRTVETLDELTPQELQVARVAIEGLTNSEIGAQLFLSPRTVEWHLRKVFAKLGVSSRKQLGAALQDPTRTVLGV